MLQYAFQLKLCFTLLAHVVTLKKKPNKFQILGRNQVSLIIEVSG
jgi:hypothetical protein